MLAMLAMRNKNNWRKRRRKCHKLITSKGNEQQPNETWPQLNGNPKARNQIFRICNMNPRISTSFDTMTNFI